LRERERERERRSVVREREIKKTYWKSILEELLFVVRAFLRLSKTFEKRGLKKVF
jgi:hypothetical protein